MSNAPKQNFNVINDVPVLSRMRLSTDGKCVRILPKKSVIILCANFWFAFKPYRLFDASQILLSYTGNYSQVLGRNNIY